MSPGSIDIDDEISQLISLEVLIQRIKRVRRINETLNDPIYLAALDWRDVFGKKLDKALVEYVLGNSRQHLW